MAATWQRDKTDKEEEEFLVRFELPILVGAWIIFLITFGYLLYIGV
jgi:formate-dependent nitrite reductase membrane component NrfD